MTGDDPPRAETGTAPATFALKRASVYCSIDMVAAIRNVSSDTWGCRYFSRLASLAFSCLGLGVASGFAPDLVSLAVVFPPPLP
jgi:hypothetical protein